MNRDYSQLDENFITNAADLCEDLIIALNFAAKQIDQDPKLIMNFVIDYLNTHMDCN